MRNNKLSYFSIRSKFQVHHSNTITMLNNNKTVMILKSSNNKNNNKDKDKRTMKIKIGARIWKSELNPS